MHITMMPDQATVRDLLRKIGMEVAENHIHQVEGGTINSAFRIDQGKDASLILRISPSDAEAEAGPCWLTSHGLRREQTTIGLLTEIEDLLPRTIHFDESREFIDRDWVLQTWIRGESWSDLRPGLTDDEDMELWRELGRVTRKIHSIVGEEFGPPEAGLGYATWPDLIRWDVSGLSVDAHRYGIDREPFEELQALVDQAMPVLDKITVPRLIHSDLGQRHVFIARGGDDRYGITGLIDFEFARFADQYSESVFLDDALLPGQDSRDAALCEGYVCDRPTHDDQLRRQIYTLTSIGWAVTDMARTQQTKQIPAMLDRMRDLLQDARDMM